MNLIWVQIKDFHTSKGAVSVKWLTEGPIEHHLDDTTGIFCKLLGNHIPEHSNRVVGAVFTPMWARVIVHIGSTGVSTPPEIICNVAQQCVLQGEHLPLDPSILMGQVFGFAPKESLVTWYGLGNQFNQWCVVFISDVARILGNKPFFECTQYLLAVLISHLRPEDLSIDQAASQDDVSEVLRGRLPIPHQG